MKLRKYSQLKFGLVLGLGALIAMLLCVQCVRTYLYMDSVLVPQQAEHEAARQAGALSAAARSAGITEPRGLTPVLERAMESAADHVLWMRVLDMNGIVFAQSGNPEGAAQFLAHWWDRVEKHERLGTVLDTAKGKALVVMLPLRISHVPPASDAKARLRPGPSDDRRTAYVLEVAISLKAVSGAFAGLRQNLILGLIASIALLLSVAVIGLRARHYLRGKYLESELQLAKRVQSDLQPKPHSVSRHVEFAASAVAADHVGGDFYDIFEAESGKVAIVLGDVSGKGVSAALLVSVLQGAIRSSTASEHEAACERINRMLCERTACERFATLFWGIYDPVTRMLRYVNAGHAAPILLRRSEGFLGRLDEGGPVLGLLPGARYSAGMVKIGEADSLILYSDGISEAMDRNKQEFGEERIERITLKTADTRPAEVCTRLMSEVTDFASAEVPQDDRTLMVVQFPPSSAALRARKVDEIGISAVA